jgi:hypothetical protein
MDLARHLAYTALPYPHKPALFFFFLHFTDEAIKAKKIGQMTQLSPEPLSTAI